MMTVLFSYSYFKYGMENLLSTESINFTIPLTFPEAPLTGQILSRGFL